MGNLEVKTDMGIALKLESHIRNPCATQIGGKIYDLRVFYLREARIILPTLENFGAREFLEGVIKEYS